MMEGLCVIAYCVIAGIVYGVGCEINDDEETFGIMIIGIFWPVTIPTYIGYLLIRLLIRFVRSYI
jgi:hypothetical protein